MKEQGPVSAASMAGLANVTCEALDEASKAVERATALLSGDAFQQSASVRDAADMVDQAVAELARAAARLDTAKRWTEEVATRGVA